MVDWLEEDIPQQSRGTRPWLSAGLLSQTQLLSSHPPPLQILIASPHPNFYQVSRMAIVLDGHHGHHPRHLGHRPHPQRKMIHHLYLSCVVWYEVVSCLQAKCESQLNSSKCTFTNTVFPTGDFRFRGAPLAARGLPGYLMHECRDWRVRP